MPWFQRRERIPKPLLQTLTEHHSALAALTLKVKELEDALASLEDKHERLRGKFYAIKDREPANDKAAILAAWRRGEIKA